MKYGILRYPHSNRRYFESTAGLLVSELTVLSDALGIGADNIRYESVGGLELLTFEANQLEHRQLNAISSLSALFVLFEFSGDALVPVQEHGAKYFKDDLSGILKYSGKTNENFTGFLINMGVFSSAFAAQFDEPLNILDPMCGRGTSLYEGLIRGYNVSGVEIRKTECQEIDKYLKRYLKYHKYKHDAAHQTIVTRDKSRCPKYTIETADTVENYKKKDRRLIQFAAGNTLHVNDFYKKNTFHVLVTDVPYGIQHDAKAGSKPVDMLGLIQEACREWRKVLKKGGAAVVSYNAYTLDKSKLEAAFADAGYEVLTDGIYGQLEHWVEQAVNRDVLVALKK